MESIYSKIGTVIAILALVITLWQINKKRVAEFKGEWIMTSTIQEAQMASYVDMRIEWVLHLTQNGQEIKGTGEKIKVNDVELEFSKRTKFHLRGTINGKKFTLGYEEHGLKRETNGTFIGVINDNKFIGKFSQTASDSKGIIIGKKKE